MRIHFAGAIALALTTSAAAQTDDTGAVEATALERLLVTGGLTPVEAEKSGRAHSVITAEELRERQVRYVADALRTVPGFAVSRAGALGGQTQIRVRGAESNHLLVLIDGVEVSEASTGEFDFGSLLVSDIERIEVLRGPQSAFWGSNAMAGVVNIITKRGARDGFTTQATTETGSDGTFLGGVLVSGGRDNYDMALSGAFRRSDGFNVSDFGSEEDGGRNATLNGNFSLDLSPALTLDGTLRYVDRRAKTDPQDFVFLSPTQGRVIDGNDETSTQDLFGSIGAEHVALDGALTQKLRFEGGDTFRENFTDGGAISSSKGNRYNASYHATYEFETPGLFDGFHKLTGGYEWERETYRASHLADRLGRESNSFVGEYRGEFLGQFYLNAALRQDFNDRFADATTYSVSGAWLVPGTATRLHTSVGTGVTNPTFVEQFGFTPENFVGNPDLVPEESFGWDIGIEQGFFGGALVVDLTYFNQDLTNEIATVFGPAPDFISTVVNREGESMRQGVEVAATLDFFNGFSATGTYTYTDATEQTAAGGPRQREVRRPMHSGSLGAAYRFHEGRARVFAEMIFNGETEDVAFVPSLPPRVTLDAYQVVNIGGSYRFSEKLEAFGRIENLFDEDYEEVFDHNTRGLAAFAGLRGTF